MNSWSDRQNNVVAFAEVIEKPVLVPGSEGDEESLALTGVLVKSPLDERVVRGVDVVPTAETEIVVEEAVVPIQSAATL